MEDLGNVEQTDDVAVIVTDGLPSAKLQICKHTRCLKPLLTISCRASVALVESLVTIGFLVIICATVVILGSRASAVTLTYQYPTGTGIHTLKARSFAVKIPLSPSSSSTTNTQSVLFAAHS